MYVCDLFFTLNILSSVHSFGNRDNPEPTGYKVEKNKEQRSTATFLYEAAGTSAFRNTNVSVINWFHTPCTAATRVSRASDVKVVEVHAVQRKPGLIEVYYCLSRNFWTWSWIDPLFRFAMQTTLAEDKAILETVDYEKGNKINTKYDALQLHFRRALKRKQRTTKTNAIVHLQTYDI